MGLNPEPGGQPSLVNASPNSVKVLRVSPMSFPSSTPSMVTSPPMQVYWNCSALTANKQTAASLRQLLTVEAISERTDRGLTEVEMFELRQVSAGAELVEDVVVPLAVRLNETSGSVPGQPDRPSRPALKLPGKSPWISPRDTSSCWLR